MAGEMIRVIRDDEARLNVTWDGQNGDLVDPVPVNASDTDIRDWAAEAVRTGSIPGIPADRNADFHDFVVDRHGPNEVRSWSAYFVRPKTPFGM